MKKIAKMYYASLSLVSFLLFAHAANAETLNATYDSDPFADEYNSIAQAIFEEFSHWRCSVREVVWGEKEIIKFKRKYDLRSDAVISRGACDIPPGACFIEDKKETCFDNNGIVWMGAVRLRSKNRRANVAWNYLFPNERDSGSKPDGIVLQQIILEKVEDEWVVSENIHKWTMDSRD